MKYTLVKHANEVDLTIVHRFTVYTYCQLFHEVCTSEICTLLVIIKGIFCVTCDA